MWQLVIEVDSADQSPRYLQISRAIVEVVRGGRLRPGDPLPSTRALAAQLRVHRKTVTAAYRDLAGQGWISIERARGARVSVELPDIPRARTARVVAHRAGFALPDAPVAPERWRPRPPRQLLLLGGVPDLEGAPRLAIGRAYRAAIAARTGGALLDYGDPRGDLALRTALADYLVRTRGLAATADSITVVHGSQHALYLVARTLLRPGDRVAVEALGYPSAWQALRAAGVVIEPVRVDESGIDVAALDALCARHPIRAVYVTPHHQCPTTVTLTAARRVALMALARRRALAILEDDYDHEYRYDGQPVLPLASADRDGLVCYVGTLAKVLAPGLRLGYLVATPDVIDQVAAYRSIVDGQGDHVLERAIAELLGDGTLESHVRRMRRTYRERRDALCAALRSELPALEFTPPHGGMALWARAPGVDVDRWVERARADGVSFQAASRFAFDGRPRDFLRLGFGACNERELAVAARRLAATIPRRR